MVRGNNRQNIFNNEQDMNEYFRILNFVYGKYPFELYAYCIMSNHVHLLIRSRLVPLWKNHGATQPAVQRLLPNEV
ncbi:transposase [Sporosarcina luteola]|uniref:transposase n=1 Tax=Sporosarcina luteola TaxID=582850 RepID=UPI003340719F